MAFLDNSGDIILDAVLTDTGRMRLARGDGSFRIAKFALGDDEIDYSQYQNANYVDGAHASGSAYYDLEIVQTPVLEAFTNNTSNLKSKLISISRTNIQYLPELVLNTVHPDGAINTASPNQNTFLVAVNTDTEVALLGAGGALEAGTIKSAMAGSTVSTESSFRVILDQGINSNEAGSNSTPIPGDLIETQYIVEIDDRFGSVVDMTGQISAAASFIDDDNIASYFLTLNTDKKFIERIPPVPAERTGVYPAVSGPLGTRLQFSIRASLDLSSNNYLFTRLGGTVTIGSTSYKNIDATVIVTGGKTGYRLDIPVRFLKKA